jgi:hypothetical protein
VQTLKLIWNLKIQTWKPKPTSLNNKPYVQIVKSGLNPNLKHYTITSTLIFKH